MRMRDKKIVAEATALGALVLQAELFISRKIAEKAIVLRWDGSWRL